MTSPFLRLYLSALAVLLVLDGLWLGVVARAFYVKHIGYLMGERLVWWAVATFYALYPAGIAVLTAGPSARGGDLPGAFFKGALLGLLAYGAYNLTNQATVARWPVVVTVVDMTWGAAVTALASLAAAWAASR
ncbi:MAG: DUF2177 family protein [Acidobacteriota bacterium]